MKRILERLVFRLIIDGWILYLHVKARAYAVAAYLVGIEIRVIDRLLGRDGW